MLFWVNIHIMIGWYHFSVFYFIYALDSNCSCE